MRGWSNPAAAVAALVAAFAGAGAARALGDPEDAELEPGRPFTAELAGYRVRAPNEKGWDLEHAGYTRHTLRREDRAAEIRLWMSRRLPGEPADGAACEAEVLSRLEQGRATRRKTETVKRGGLEILAGEWQAAGGGSYFTAAAAAQGFCYGFLAFVAATATAPTIAEVRAAHASFEVDAQAPK